MKKVPNRFFSSFYTTLWLILSVVVIIIAGVTLWAFVSGQATPGSGLRKADPAPEKVVRMIQKEKKSSESAIFSELGQMRVTTADTPAVIIIVTPFFPYNTTDSAFQEELIYKNRSIRAKIQEYFASSLHSDLLQRGEETVKADLLQLINADLILGSIDNLYFSEYLFLE